MILTRVSNLAAHWSGKGQVSLEFCRDFILKVYGWHRDKDRLALQLQGSNNVSKIYLFLENTPHYYPTEEGKHEANE